MGIQKTIPARREITLRENNVSQYALDWMGYFPLEPVEGVSERNYQIAYAHIEEGESYRSLSKRYDISHERIRQIVTQVVRRLEFKSDPAHLNPSKTAGQKKDFSIFKGHFPSGEIEGVRDRDREIAYALVEEDETYLSLAERYELSVQRIRQIATHVVSHIEIETPVG